MVEDHAFVLSILFSIKGSMVGIRTGLLEVRIIRGDTYPVLLGLFCCPQLPII
jgi:hypothetical protein